MSEHAVFRCQLLPVLVKCRPGSPDSILDFGRLLIAGDSPVGISSLLNWMNACVIGFAGHSILAFSIVIPISVIVSFRSCMTFDSDDSLLNPVVTALP